MAEVALLHVPGLHLRGHAGDKLDLGEHNNGRADFERFRFLGASGDFVGYWVVVRVDVGGTAGVPGS